MRDNESLCSMRNDGESCSAVEDDERPNPPSDYESEACACFIVSDQKYTCYNCEMRDRSGINDDGPCDFEVPKKRIRRKRPIIPGQEYWSSSSQPSDGTRTPNTWTSSSEMEVPSFENLSIDDFDDAAVCEDHRREECCAIRNDEGNESVLLDHIDGLFARLSAEAKAISIARRLKPSSPSIGSANHEWEFDTKSTFHKLPYCIKHIFGIPQIAVALTGFSIDGNLDKFKGGVAGLFISPTNQRKSEFDMHLATKRHTSYLIADSIRFDWLELQACHTNDGLWQHGHWSLDATAWLEADGLHNGDEGHAFITFEAAYEEVPSVVLFVTGFGASPRNLRLAVSAEDITTTGFRLEPTTWRDTLLFEFTVAWVAYPSATKGICSGSISAKPEEPQQINMGYEAFPPGMFTKPPKVMVGLNYLDLEHRQQNIKCFVSNVTHLGMCWNADSWGETINHGAGISYLAIEES
ncbi:hypothetical protein BJ508DRAFT_335300 [Ascobolus immersus RN42]|uniref:H-type lectin domain-containing protein n=1 Tax=Ascobolus immersus RN42 TaxID=1160509 RepID=A0A3N4HCX0_ASCIM|nr:hypothetical protein BJ508DRAFT_335300 [Ascobolus immersus RN42]